MPAQPIHDMAKFKLNVLTGEFDLVGVPVKSDSEQPIETGPDGDIETQLVQSEGRLYFRVNNTLYYVTGTQAAFPVRIAGGQPIGLMGVTYAEDVT